MPKAREKLAGEALFPSTDERSRTDCREQQPVDGLGKFGTRFALQSLAFGGSQMQGTAGGSDESKRGLLRVTQQTLSQRQRIERENHTINHRVPGVRFTRLNGVQIALYQPLVAQRAQPFELGFPDALAGGGEALEQWFLVELPVQFNQFPDFITTRMAVRPPNRGPFKWEKNGRLVILEKT